MKINSLKKLIKLNKLLMYLFDKQL